jgi:hypothetical protein
MSVERSFDETNMSERVGQWGMGLSGMSVERSLMRQT